MRKTKTNELRRIQETLAESPKLSEIQALQRRIYAVNLEIEAKTLIVEQWKQQLERMLANAQLNLFQQGHSSYDLNTSSSSQVKA